LDRNKLKRAPANVSWEGSSSNTTDTEVISATMDREDTSSDESDDAENEGQQYNLRDRNIWRRDYHGMGIYIAMLAC